MAGPPLNAVDRRLKLLSDLWFDFAELPDARLLRWSVTPDDQRIVETFFEVHREDPDDVPHMFFAADTPFVDPDDHADRLAAWFRGYYADSREGLTEQGVDADWTCPAGEGQAHLVRLLATFQAHYKDLTDIVVLALLPGEIADPAAWAAWLAELTASEIPGSVRFVVVDDVERPRLAELARARPRRVVSQTPAIDTPAILRELLGESGRSGPGVDFRAHFVETMLAGRAGDVAAARRHSDAALALATANGWPQMQVVARMVLAAVVSGAGDRTQALALYTEAGDLAERGAKAGDPTAPKLVVQARMAAASVLFADQRLAEAGELYQATAALAERADDAFLALENYRMAAYCHEAGSPERSWACATRALDAAARLPAEVRVNTFLHHVGLGMLRLARRPAFAAKEREVRRRMAELIGPGWEKKAP
jgi:hypothetical protein